MQRTPHAAESDDSDDSPERPEDSARELTPQELAEAKAYNRQSLRLGLVDMALDLVVLCLLAFVVARPLDAYLASFSAMAAGSWWNDTLRLLALYGICLALHAAISLPLSFYSGYVVEHRAGLSNQSLARWVTQYIKRMVAMAVANAVLLTGLFWVIWLIGPWWWVAAAAASFVVTVLIGMIAPVLILPLFVKTEKLDDEELLTELGELAQGTGLNIEGIYRLGLSTDTKKANAALAGLGKTRRVLLGDTLLDQFTRDEIKVVMAHEVAHHVFGHIWKMMLGAIPVSLLIFWLCDRALAAWIGAGYDPHQMPVYALPLIMLLVMVIGLVTGPIGNSVMRRFERQCDWYALQRTGLIEAYRGAFTKLARLNKADPDPHWLEVFLFDDHPPIAERLAMADTFAAEKRSTA